MRWSDKGYNLSQTWPISIILVLLINLFLISCKNMREVHAVAKSFYSGVALPEPVCKAIVMASKVVRSSFKFILLFPYLLIYRNSNPPPSNAPSIFVRKLGFPNVFRPLSLPQTLSYKTIEQEKRFVSKKRNISAGHWNDLAIVGMRVNGHTKKVLHWLLFYKSTCQYSILQQTIVL
jgi:hypothetical protein